MDDREQLATLLVRDLNRALGNLPAGQRAREKLRDALLGAAKLRSVN